jgi:uncharacterized protein
LLAAAPLAGHGLAGERVQPRRGPLPKEAASIKARPFPLSQVRLLSGSCYTLQDRNRSYLHALDSDRLLHTFRLTAGLASKLSSSAAGSGPTSSCAAISWATTCRLAA